MDEISLLSKQARPLSPRLPDPYCQLWLAVIAQAALDITEPIPIGLRKLRPEGKWPKYKAPMAVKELREAVASAIRFLTVDGIGIIDSLDKLGYRVNRSMFKGLEEVAQKKIRRLETLGRLWDKLKKRNDQFTLFKNMCEDAGVSVREFFRFTGLERWTFSDYLRRGNMGYIPAKRLISAIDSFTCAFPAASEKGNELKRAIEKRRRTSRGLIHAVAVKGTVGWAVERIIEETGWTLKFLAGELGVSVTTLKKARYGVEMKERARAKFVKGAVSLAVRNPELSQKIEELILAVSRPRWPKNDAER